MYEEGLCVGVGGGRSEGGVVEGGMDGGRMEGVGEGGDHLGGGGVVQGVILLQKHAGNRSTSRQKLVVGHRRLFKGM